MSTPQLRKLVFGPLQSSNVTLFAQTSAGVMVLKPDPNTNFPPYFGIADGSVNYEQLKLTIMDSGGSAERTPSLLTSDNQGFAQDAATQTMKLVPGTGQFNYRYVPEAAVRTPLVAGELLQIVVDNVPVTFKYKNQMNEMRDRRNAGMTNYQPTYSGDVPDVVIVPIDGIPQNNCNAVTTNGPYVSYSNINGGGSTPTYFTLKTYCDDNITNPICPKDHSCGDMIGGGSCLGPCTGDLQCLPTGNQRLGCSDPMAPSRRHILDIILIIGGIVIGLILLGLFIYFIFISGNTSST